MTHAEAHPPFPDGVGRQKVVKDKEDDGEVHNLRRTAGGSLGDEESAGGWWIHNGYNLGGPADVEPETYEEPPVYYSKERLASLRSNFDSLLEMAEDGISPERAESLKFVFDEIERMALDARTVTTEERSSKRRRTL